MTHPSGLESHSSSSSSSGLSVCLCVCVPALLLCKPLVPAAQLMHGCCQQMWPAMCRLLLQPLQCSMCGYSIDLNAACIISMQSIRATICSQ